eukprot:6702579-Lingulodinium_polyedra.AAC.1
MPDDMLMNRASPPLGQRIDRGSGPFVRERGLLEVNAALGPFDLERRLHVHCHIVHLCLTSTG